MNTKLLEITINNLDHSVKGLTDSITALTQQLGSPVTLVMSAGEEDTSTPKKTTKKAASKKINKDDG